ncbi:LysR substrate-binding domain-containing protein [Novosphingobium sp. Gsoil 351]|uniref:LysR substrate-binding domain-containing protein n=1 Tax=Novosphingobium sp. Gsoil 351 TaxID=2675225 RepID=UPI0018A86BC7|nr:LysR substrate-binding domain-containing protein [Novosphingobium sp. Gsoil 351]
MNDQPSDRFGVKSERGGVSLKTKLHIDQTKFLAARAGLAALAEAEAGASAVGTEAAGLLRVTMPEAFGRRTVVPILAGLVARFPAIQLEIDLSDLPRALDRGAYDIAIRLGRVQEGEAAGELLRESRLILIGAPQYAEQCLTLDSLRQLDAVVVAENGSRFDPSIGMPVDE